MLQKWTLNLQFLSDISKFQNVSAREPICNSLLMKVNFKMWMRKNGSTIPNWYSKYHKNVCVCVCVRERERERERERDYEDLPTFIAACTILWAFDREPKTISPTLNPDSREVDDGLSREVGGIRGPLEMVEVVNQGGRVFPG